MNPNLTNPLLSHHRPPHPTMSITRLTQPNRTHRQISSMILIQLQRGQTLGQSTGNCRLHAFCSLQSFFSHMVKLTSHSSCASFMLKHNFLSTQSDQGQDEEYETEEQLHARLLTAALEFVPQHGWSMEAIAAGAEVRFRTVNLTEIRSLTCS